ncbi:hypothetical protein TSUD_182500 [Trifolium subterraneum]|uniref:Uncharacterized protein n=1 Tax=Trifolium subterraneum TaxID=3900 RepID=A0A2Z6LKG8_TRISU|nr:hypothetical protein TSUD_182500 [Trifolium subterraneum]
MAGANHANHEFVGENHPNPPNHHNQFDGQEASVTPEGSAAHAQATPPGVPQPQPPQPEDPLVVPQVPQGAPMEVVMAALVNTINRQGEILREQANNMRGQNELIREQNRRLRAVEESRAASRVSRSTRRQRSPTPVNNRSRSRSRSPRPAPRQNAERPVSPPRDIPRRQNHSPPRRNNHVSPPRNRRSPPRRNNRSPPRSGEAAARGGNARHSPRGESPSSGDERHRGPLSRRIMDIPLPRGLEKPPTLDKYDGTTDPDEHVQSVETALDYRNLRGSIKCKLFPLSLTRGASTWWRNLPPGSIDSEELCRMFTAHFTTSRRHPKTVASLKAIVQGPEESLRNYIERFNKVSVEVEATDKMKLYLLEEGLREGTKFQEAVGILEVETLDVFFELTQRYIKYEDKQKASEVRRPKNFEFGGPSSQREERRGHEKKREGGKVREAKPPKSQFTYHTPLNAPRDRILLEISNAEFKSAGIRFPKQLPAKPNVDKKKFCRFHKSYGHAGKFLDFYLTERGIEANPDKCRAFFDYPTPKSKKSIQTLNGMLTSMARFVAKSAQHALPLFKLLRKETTFEWTEECEEALQHLKRALSEPPVLTRPVEDEKLYLYLAVASEAISAVLIRETEQGQKPVYFVSRALQGPELRYLQIEKIALAVIMAARKLRYYFLAHSIIIRTDQPVKQLLARPDMVGRMLKWSLELAEFDISFENRKALKAQVLADFVAEMTTSTTSEKNKWTIFVDGSSNSQGSEAGIILENGDGVLIEVSLGLSFPTTNNQAEYEAFLAGLILAEDMGAEEIRIFTDSQLVASQVSGEYQTKEERLLEYLNLIRAKLAKFKETEVKHVPREHNARADVLSKLASTRRKKAGNQSLIQETLTKPSIEKTAEVMHICAVDEQSWMSPVYNFLKSNTVPVDAKEAAKIRKRACSYVLLDDKLYRRGFSIPLLKCVEEARIGFILQEIHERINGQHIGGRSLARKALRAGYYWPTMQNDARDHVLKCDKCQRHGDMHLAPANELKTMISPWPFAWWGMDILGPFPTAARQVKYLIVAVDYFTKWIEAEPLAKISASNILRFFKRDVLARFGIPQVVVTDNGTQFTNKKFQEFLAAIGTTQRFASVEHPQTNGQAEAANRVLLRGLRRRIGASKGNWTEELHNVLWSYRTTPHSTTGETPFRLTYGTEAVIPVEIGEPSSRIEYPLEESINDELLREELDLVEELRTGASLREATLKQKIDARHDKKVIKREFEVGSLVLRRNQKDSREGKLAANWEGPYRVRAKTENGAYHLEDLYGKEIPRTWNAEKLKRYYSTTQHFTSVEHPQTNGQAEAANRVLLRGLRRRMGASKGNWTEELHNVLWSYRTTPHSTTGETPFRLTYGTEAVIPVEIGEPSSRIEYPLEEDMNDELLREELDLVEELRTGASLREATLKQKIAARHDKRVIKREFEVGSLVLRRNQKDAREGKLAANWEGPYRVRAKTENGAYHLEDLHGKEIPRTWNAEKLKQYYS